MKAAKRKQTGRKYSHPRKIWDKGHLLFGLSLIVLAVLSAVFSFAVLMGLTPVDPDLNIVRLLTGVNVVMVLCLVAVIVREVFPVVTAWRARRAASRLHVQVIALFAMVAAVPAFVVAVVASFTLNRGLDNWFDTNTRQIVASSVNLANAYADVRLSALQAASYSMMLQLDDRRLLVLNPSEYRHQLILQASGRDLCGAFLLRHDGSVIVASKRGETIKRGEELPCREEDMPIPPPELIKKATVGQPFTFQPGAHDYFGVVLKMPTIDDAWLYIGSKTDKTVLDALRMTEKNTDKYRALEEIRYPMQIAFAVLYLCLFLILLLAAIWTAMAIADRIVRPIRLLIGAADSVAAGNLEVVVPVRARDGDVGQLARTFNYMVAEVKGQRNELIAVRDQIDERRRFSEALLSGVTASVIGVDEEGHITIINRSAEEMLGFSPQEVLGKSLIAVSGEIGQVFEVARSSGKKSLREQVTIAHNGQARAYIVQIIMEEAESENHSWVVTVDDVTELIEAQRSSAWADVARRIAHEIKNPLTPIQLSAERIRRRYGNVIVEDREVFDQCTETIIRQVEDIGRMVDEFSSFARMPKPELRKMDVRIPLREAAFLVEVSRHDIIFERDLGDKPLTSAFDNRLIGQAFGNVIKNAGEAIDAVGVAEDYHGHILVRARQKDDKLVVDIIDNGKGLPKEQRQKLLEPYMTTREKGTGLGLAIVRKIVEEHDGTMELHDAPKDFYHGRGAMIRMVFPAMITGKGSDAALPDKMTGGE